MRQDAQAALRTELDKLIDAADESDKEFFNNEFSAFANLFERFLQERGPSVEWDKIRPPREGMVSSVLFSNRLSLRNKPRDHSFFLSCSYIIHNWS